VSRSASLKKHVSIWAVAGLLALLALAYSFQSTEVGAPSTEITLAHDFDPDRRLTFHMVAWDLPKAIYAYSELTGRDLTPQRSRFGQVLDRMTGGRLTAWRLIPPSGKMDSGIAFHGDGRLTAAELKIELECAFATNGLYPAKVGTDSWRFGNVNAASRAEACLHPGQ
jgi:hypothetical protein